MSGIYIPGMEMPTGAGINVTTIFDAQINVYGDGTASIDVKENQHSPMGRCPLIPVPDHGRLIDADALPWEKQGLLVADEGWALPCSIIENAPTVIPADKEKRQ